MAQLKSSTVHGDLTVTGESNLSSLKVAGETAWHAGNDGAGSGLDADTVDGKHASDFAPTSHGHTATQISGLSDAATTPVATIRSGTTAANVGLGNVPNWTATASVADASDTKFATAGAVKKAYDRVPTYAEVTGKPATFTPTAHTHPVSQVTGLSDAATTTVAAIRAGTTAANVGLGNVPNWTGTASVNDASDTKFATAGAVKKAYDKVPTWANILLKPETATRWPTYAEVTGLGTAASKDVGTSAGNVMEVGAHGIGDVGTHAAYQAPTSLLYNGFWEGNCVTINSKDSPYASLLVLQQNKLTYGSINDADGIWATEIITDQNQVVLGKTAETARSALELGSAATADLGTAAGTVAEGNDSRMVNALQKGNNLSDVVDKEASRTNLGLNLTDAEIIKLKALLATVLVDDVDVTFGGTLNAADVYIRGIDEEEEELPVGE